MLLFKDLFRKTGMGVPIPVLDLAAKNNKLLIFYTLFGVLLFFIV